MRCHNETARAAVCRAIRQTRTELVDAVVMSLITEAFESVSNNRLHAWATAWVDTLREAICHENETIYRAFVSDAVAEMTKADVALPSSVAATTAVLMYTALYLLGHIPDAMRADAFGHLVDFGRRYLADYMVAYQNTLVN